MNIKRLGILTLIAAGLAGCNSGDSIRNSLIQERGT